MQKFILTGVVAAVIAFFVAQIPVAAQSPMPSPSPTPQGAPNTGFGG